MPKLRSADRVRTNTLLGHNTDQTPPYSFSFLRPPFSHIAIILSRFLLVHTSLEHLHVLDVLSLQRTLLDTNTATPSPLRVPTTRTSTAWRNLARCETLFANRPRTVFPLPLRSGHRLEPPQNLAKQWQSGSPYSAHNFTIGAQRSNRVFSHPTCLQRT